MAKRKFDYKLSLLIDACYVELEHIQALPNTPRKVVRLILLRCKLAKLERKILVV